MQIFINKTLINVIYTLIEKNRMKIKILKFPEVKVIIPKIHNDNRGFFFESYNKRNLKVNELNYNFIQDNFSFSKKGVIRCMHHQKYPFHQTKLVSVIKGEIFDVVVDYRKKSVNFLKHIAIKISDKNRKHLLIPKGFLHGFQVISDFAIVHYKVDKPYSPNHERTILYNNIDLGISWPIKKIIISKKDSLGT